MPSSGRIYEANAALIRGSTIHMRAAPDAAQTPRPSPKDNHILEASRSPFDRGSSSPSAEEIPKKVKGFHPLRQRTPSQLAALTS